jgi:hypothetical protein
MNLVTCIQQSSQITLTNTFARADSAAPPRMSRGQK